MPALSNETVAPAAVGAPAPAADFPSPFLDVVQGVVPGVSISPIVDGTTDEVQEFAVQNFDKLTGAGLEYLELPDDVSVFYNPQSVSEKDILAASTDGSLAQLAPPAVQLGAPPGVPNSEPATSGAPALAAQQAAPASGSLAGVSAAPVATSGPGGLETARLRNAAPPKPNTPGGPIPVLQRRAV